MILFSLLMIACGSDSDDALYLEQSKAQSLSYVETMYPQKEVTRNCMNRFGSSWWCDLRVWEDGKVSMSEQIACSPNDCRSYEFKAYPPVVYTTQGPQ